MIILSTGTTISISELTNYNVLTLFGTNEKVKILINLEVNLIAEITKK